MLKAAFEELLVERGEIINILGMTVHMERGKLLGLMEGGRRIGAQCLLSRSVGFVR